MAQRGLTHFFETFLTQENLFKKKEVLQSSYTPDSVVHRDNEISQIAHILAPALRLEKPSNLFLYGKTGTGKTLSIKYTTDQMQYVARQKNIPLTVLYVNCKLSRVADTEYRLIAQLARDLGKAIPPTGLPTDEVYKSFYTALEKEKRVVLLVLDEIDQLVRKAGDAILYNLTRINSELKNTQICLIGISNDLMFTEHLDPRVKSSLSEEELVFPPYNAIQLQDILKRRSHIAFKEGVIQDGVIEKCAAYAAREHGDARRALELLRVAGEIAERQGHKVIALVHLDEAEEKIEKERVIEVVKTQPKQQQVTLYAILLLLSHRKESLYTGEVYDLYRDLCNKIGLRPLTQRRISDIVAELDMLGIIKAKTISKGRFGRTREIVLAVPPFLKPQIKTLLEQTLSL